jgi:cation diffusion facilitator family transporter
LDRAQRTALLAAASYLVLTVFLVVVYVYTRSDGIALGVLITVVRMVTAITLVFGMRLSERHTKNFPSGLYKLQNLLQVLIGFAIMFVAYEFVKLSIDNASTTKKTTHLPLLISAILIPALVAGFFAWYKRKVGIEENSPGLKADAYNSLGDFIALDAILIGILLAVAGLEIMAPIAAAIAAGYMVYLGIRVVLSGMKVLLDASVDRQVLDQVKQVALSEPQVSDVLDVKGRSAGGYSFIHMNVLVVTRDLREADRVGRDLERIISGAIPNVDRVQVEFEVEQKGRLLSAVPLGEDSSTIDAGFADAQAFELLTLDVEGGTVVSRESVDNPVPAAATGRGVRVAVFLARRGAELLYLGAPLDDDDVTGTLEAYGIEIYTGAAETLAEAEKLLLERAGELYKAMPEPDAQTEGAA